MSIVLHVPGQRESGQGGKPTVFKMGNKALKSGTPHTTLRDLGKDKKKCLGSVILGHCADLHWGVGSLPDGRGGPGTGQ